jgi:hypothetical protein
MLHKELAEGIPVRKHALNRNESNIIGQWKVAITCVQNMIESNFQQIRAN